jgi:hypothetical protein
MDQRLPITAAKHVYILTHQRSRRRGSSGVGGDLKASQVGGKTRNFGQGLDGLECVVHLFLAHFVGDHNNFSTSFAGVELNNRLDRYPTIPEAAPNPTNDAGSILCVEAHVMALTDFALIHQHATTPAVRRKQRVQSMIALSHLANSSDVEDVCHNG